MSSRVDAVIQHLEQTLATPDTPQITRGRSVIALGPWSNGHEEQAAVITNVYGSGLPGDLVNLFVFVDLGQPLVLEGVPWYPSRAVAEQALAANTETANIIGGAVCCYFPDRS